MKLLSALSWLIAILVTALPGWAQPARPDLGSMALPVRQAIERLQAAVDALEQRQATTDVELGDAYFALGEAYHAHGLSDSAIDAYRHSLELHPTGDRTAYYLGCLLQQAGQMEEASARFETVLARGGDDPALLIRLGNVRLEQAENEVAQQLFSRALAADDSLAAAHYGQGRAALAMGEAQAAVDHFSRALELQPEASVVHYPLAQAYRRLGQVDRARRHLEQLGQVDVTFPDPGLERLSRIAATSALQVVLSLAADREHFSPRDYLGFTLGQLGKTVGSVEYLRQVIAGKGPVRQPHQAVELARIHYAIAGLLVLEGRDADALTELRSAVELAPAFAAGHIMLANALARTGDFAAAARHYDRALEIDPELTEAWLKRSAVRLRLGQDDQALAELRRLTISQPEVAEGWLRLGALLQRRDESAAARSAYQRAIDLDLADSEKAATHRALADLLRQDGQLDQAVDHYRSALSFEPTSIQARLDLAGSLGFLDRYAEAAAEYRRAVDAEPDNETARLGEVSALVLARRYREVRGRLVEAHDALPESASLAHLLARFLVASPDETLRDGRRALELAEPLLERRRSLTIGETVAMALAATGRVEQAAALQRSLFSAARQGNAGEAVTSRLAANLALYEAGQECCAETGPAVLLPPPEPPPVGARDRDSE